MEVAEHVEALAFRHGVEAAEIVRRFITAGLEANPAPDAKERVGAKLKKAGQIPGLVIPLSRTTDAAEWAAKRARAAAKRGGA